MFYYCVWYDLTWIRRYLQCFFNLPFELKLATQVVCFCISAISRFFINYNNVHCAVCYWQSVTIIVRASNFRLAEFDVLYVFDENIIQLLTLSFIYCLTFKIFSLSLDVIRHRQSACFMIYSVLLIVRLVIVFFSVIVFISKAIVWPNFCRTLSHIL